MVLGISSVAAVIRPQGLQMDDAMSAMYTKLRPGGSQFRLLRIHDSDAPGNEIYCTLSVHSLESPPSYQALSYVWGSEKNKVAIDVNGQRMPVTQNLYAALKNIHTRSFIWIDAICINQHDNTERSDQVSFMRLIYGKAVGVIAWLGEATDDSDVAIKFANLISRDYLLSTTRIDGRHRSTLAEIFAPGYGEKFKALGKLLVRPYWTRVWILQEMVFGQDCWMWCGRERVNWLNLHCAIKYWQSGALCSAALILPNRPLEGQMVPLHATVLEVLDRRLAQTESPEHQTAAFNLMAVTRAWESTDPRDKIFGLLGFSEISSLGVRCDYNLAIEDVYRTFVRVFIERQNLDILALGGIGWPTRPPRLITKPATWLYKSRRHPPLCLPSWVPDFRGGLEPRIVPLTAQFRADGATFPASVRIDGDRLTIRGIFVGRVEQTQKFGTIGDYCKIEGLTGPLSVGSNDYPTGIPRLQAIFRTLKTDRSVLRYGKLEFPDDTVDHRLLFFSFAASWLFTLGCSAGNKLDIEAAPEASDAELRDEIEKFLDAQPEYVSKFVFWQKRLKYPYSRDNILEPFTGPPGTASYLAWDSSYDDYQSLLPMFTSECTRKCSRRAFFNLHSGYIGHGPQLTRAGDVVFVVGGCHAPLILRPLKAGVYSLVGDAYVCGIMNGEVQQNHAPGVPVTIQDITLV